MKKSSASVTLSLLGALALGLGCGQTPTTEAGGGDFGEQRDEDEQLIDENDPVNPDGTRTAANGRIYRRVGSRIIFLSASHFGRSSGSGGHAPAVVRGGFGASGHALSGGS